MVPMWMFATAIACGQHVHPQAVGEGPVGIDLHRRAAHGSGRARRRLQRRPRRQGGGRRDPRASRHRRRQLRRLDTRSRATSTRQARRTASACRRSAAPRTTWSCCPTPTSTWPPTRPSRPVTARPASGAWRSRRSWPSVTSPIRWSRRSTKRLPKIKVGPGTDPAAEMGPLVTRQHRDKVASLPRQGRRRRARRSSPTAGSTRSTAKRRLLPGRVADRQRHARRWTRTATRSSARC